jgi:hypothetical protein
MPYNFEFAVSAQISAKVAEDMIRKVVEEQTGKKVASLEMKFRTVTKGMGPSESTERVFDGCSVFFANEKTTSSPDRGFKAETYANN